MINEMKEMCLKILAEISIRELKEAYKKDILKALKENDESFIPNNRIIEALSKTLEEIKKEGAQSE
ncbi:hypothetical protein [Clostridium frigidicarnis]|uniref:Uncharacterized protein n=1 Tax=Clostridium frigidicarnis TaxID=84698 RepID=A0A1I0V2T3_9CLOT|nr:hypothetical protein [Clostridium frigidicarnis]SFA70390.1 hypothetical protein SAMN04488528_1001105 [Clostridium frigidicarnis]